jgi:manganese/zinc/iron transport system substrate-binding protein
MFPTRVQVLVFGCLLGACLVLAGCNASGKAGDEPAKRPASRGSIKLVCTTGMVADLARQVGGAHVVVDQLMGEGVDPHLYKPSTGDIARLDAADIVFYSGLHLEGKMGEIFARMAKRKPMVAVTDGLPRDRLLRIGPEQYDPHVWFDVGLWSETLREVTKALIEFDPSNTLDYQIAANSHAAVLARLDGDVREQLSRIPASRRVLVTAHDAFHYFGRAYNLEVKAIQGVSTESEAGVREINDLVDFIVARGIKAVFVESSVSNRNVEALVEGAAAQGHRLVVGGELFSDAMGKPGTPEGTYVGMVRHNVDTIVEALR